MTVFGALVCCEVNYEMRAQKRTKAKKESLCARTPEKREARVTKKVSIRPNARK
jgi:hypothetical protein